MGPKRALTPEEESEIVARYSVGSPVRVIARDFPHVSLQTVHNTLKRHDVSVRPELSKRRLTNEQRDLVVASARGGGYTVPQLAAAFGTSGETILRILKAAGVRLAKGRPRTCAIDDAAFDTITPESAYWMGFLFADGCVAHDKYGSPRLVCGLGVKDREHLEKLRAFLKSTHVVRVTKKTRTSFGGPFVYLAPRSRQICAALEARGLVTKRERAPAPELAASRDFWRGMVDGDGCLGVTQRTQNNYITPYIALAGSRILLDAFHLFLIANGCAALNPSPTQSGIFKVDTTGATASGIIRLLYANAGEALPRKRVRARAILSGDLRKSAPYVEEPASIDVEALTANVSEEWSDDD